MIGERHARIIRRVFVITWRNSLPPLARGIHELRFVPAFRAAKKIRSIEKWLGDP